MSVGKKALAMSGVVGLVVLWAVFCRSEAPLGFLALTKFESVLFRSLFAGLFVHFLWLNLDGFAAGIKGLRIDKRGVSDLWFSAITLPVAYIICVFPLSILLNESSVSGYVRFSPPDAKVIVYRLTDTAAVAGGLSVVGFIVMQYVIFRRVIDTGIMVLLSVITLNTVLLQAAMFGICLAWSMLLLIAGRLILHEVGKLMALAKIKRLL